MHRYRAAVDEEIDGQPGVGSHEPGVRGQAVVGRVGILFAKRIARVVVARCRRCKAQITPRRRERSRRVAVERALSPVTSGAKTLAVSAGRLIADLGRDLATGGARSFGGGPATGLVVGADVALVWCRSVPVVAILFLF